jgi:hypothetical protein
MQGSGTINANNMREPASDQQSVLNPEACAMRDRFARLFSEFLALAGRRSPTRASPLTRIQALLEGFGKLRKLVVPRELAQAADDHETIRALMMGYAEAVDRYRRQQEQDAEDFNLLGVMQLTGNEVRHSMVLAWLLDHDIRKLGTHAQGNLGFRLFLNAFHLPSHYAECKYWVRREVPGDVSKVDVEAACRGQFLIHIENKIWSSERNNQTGREWSDLQRQAESLGVKAGHVHAFFLTPDGRKASDANFTAISWSRIARVLEHFADQAKPPDVKLFAAHYARTVRRFIAIHDRREDEHGEEPIE